MHKLAARGGGVFALLRVNFSILDALHPHLDVKAPATRALAFTTPHQVINFRLSYNNVG